MPNRFRIEGAREMSRVLKQLPRELQERTVLTALRAGARVIQQAADQNLSKAGVTGASFARARGGSADGKPQRMTRVVRARDSSRRRPKVLIGTHKDAFFLLFREFGTAPHRIVPNRRRGRRALADRETGQFFGAEVMHPGEPARPWLRPAFDTNQNRALEMMGKSLGRSIERAATRLAGRFSKSGLARSRFARHRGRRR